MIQGPPISGKTTLVNEILKESKNDFVHLTVNDLFINPNLSTISIIEKEINLNKIIFLDDIEIIFPNSEPDFNMIERFLSKKPKLIATCRDLKEINPFIYHYFTDFFQLDKLPSNKNNKYCSNITMDDIGGSVVAKELILMMASWCIINSSKIIEWGLKPPSGAILYGPPGTGKTLLAKAVANATNCMFFSISIPDLLRCEVGESEKRLTRLFENARADSPSIIFIDEIQALFGKRNEHKIDSNRLVVQLITQLDLSSSQGNIFCLAATNAIEAVDNALLQPGRFEEIIEINLPNYEDRIDIFKVILKNIKSDKNILNNLEILSKMTEGFSSSDISGICQKSSILALMNNKEQLTFEELKLVIQEELLKQSKNKIFNKLN